MAELIVFKPNELLKRLLRNGHGKTHHYCESRLVPANLTGLLEFPTAQERDIARIALFDNADVSKFDHRCDCSITDVMGLTKFLRIDWATLGERAHCAYARSIDAMMGTEVPGMAEYSERKSISLFREWVDENMEEDVALLELYDRAPGLTVRLSFSNLADYTLWRLRYANY